MLLKYWTVLLLLFWAVGAIAAVRKPSSSNKASNDMDDQVVTQSGGMRLGSTNEIVPDASAEHPLVIAHPEDQPLCKPTQPIQPSQSLQVMNGYDAIVLTNVENPKKVIVDQANHVLVVSGNNKGLLYSVRMDQCGNAETLQILDAAQQELDGPIAHYGLALYGGHVYVATTNSVYRFPYVDGQHTSLEQGIKVLTNINPNNANAQPDIAIDPFGHAFVPRAPVDDTLAPEQAIIKRFNFRAVPSDGYDYQTDGEIYAYGTNSYGVMAFDAQARLWGIDAPYEPFNRADLGGDVFSQAEEINLYEFPHKNYGFPYCFTEYDLHPYTENAKGKGAQWGHPRFMNGSVNLDEYCQQEDNNRRPAVLLVPGARATSLYFFMGTFCSVGDDETLGTSVGMPCNWTDTPIVAYHGLPGEAEGHRVVHLPFDDLGHKPRWDKEEQVIFQAAQPCSADTAGNCISPFGVAVDAYGRLLVSSDETNEIFMISRLYNERAAQMLTEKDNAKQAREDAIAEAKEEQEEPRKNRAKGIPEDDDDIEEETSKKDTETKETAEDDDIKEEISKKHAPKKATKEDDDDNL